jgi:hypothetical protein
MSHKYKIDRWDPVIIGKDVYPKPLIYLKADDILLKFAEKNSNALVIKISDTNSIYDGKFIQGIFYNSSEIPNCRPNFFNATKFYAIYLISEWHSYPINTGFCEIYGLYGGDNVDKVDLTTIPSKKQMVKELQDTNTISMSISNSIFFLAVCILFFVLLIYLYIKYTT